MELFNASRLEQVLSALLARLNQQEMRIVHLEKELAACPRRDALDAFHASQEQRAAGLQLHAERLGETVARTDGALRALAERVSLLERKAQQREQLLEDERAGLQRFREEVLDVVQQKLDMRKWLFTTSHEQTLAELRAVQGLLAQKVDRAEVPAIKAAASRVHEALEMRDRVEQELRRLSSEVLTLRHAVNEKESKDATLQRMQTLHKMISAKVDQAWLQTHVVDRLEAVRSKSLPVRVQERQERQEARLEQLESALRVVMESTQRLSDHSEQLYREVKAVGEARKVADQHVLAVKRQSEEARSLLEASAKANTAYITDLRQQFAELKAEQVSLDRKLKLALKFLDWFTEARQQLQGA